MQDSPARIQQRDFKGARYVQLRQQMRIIPIEFYAQFFALIERKPRGGVAIGELFRSRLLVLGRNEANGRVGSGFPLGQNRHAQQAQAKGQKNGEHSVFMHEKTSRILSKRYPHA